MADLKTKPMTYDERRQLRLGIDKLPGDNFCKIVEILQRFESSLRVSDPDEVDIDFESLKPSTLRALEAFVLTGHDLESKEVDLILFDDEECFDKEKEEVKGIFNVDKTLLLKPAAHW